MANSQIKLAYSKRNSKTPSTNSKITLGESISNTSRNSLKDKTTSSRKYIYLEPNAPKTSLNLTIFTPFVKNITPKKLKNSKKSSPINSLPSKTFKKH